MSRSGDYNDPLGHVYESIRPSQDAGSMQLPASRRPIKRPVSSDSSTTYYMVPRPRLRSQASAWRQPHPYSSGRHIQPGVSGTVPQTPAPSRQETIHSLPSRRMGNVRWPGEGTSHIPLLYRPDNQESGENRVTLIVREMERDATLMEDNPLSEQLRTEVLREMPEPLTVKRAIKSNLVRSVGQKSKRVPLSTRKLLKYTLSMYLRKVTDTVRNLLYTLELWHSSLKTIEGHFGSGVATYFRFLRWLFVLDTAVFLISFGLVVIPQWLHEPVKGNRLQGTNVTFFTPSHRDDFFHLLEEKNSTIYLLTPVPVTAAVWTEGAPWDSKYQDRTMSYAASVDFSFGDIFTGQGYFTDTALFHGSYTNESVSMVDGLSYHMPPAYFFTVLACYILIFVVLSASMAGSYRRTFIETAGDAKDIFFSKVFCGWDFGIATRDAADLKSNSIYNELQELLGDMMKEDAELTCQDRCSFLTLRVGLNMFVGLLIAGSGVLIWFLLYWEVGNGDTTVGEYKTTMIIPIIVTIIMMAAPILFSWMTSVEDYANPRVALFVTLIKTFLMEAVVIGIIVAFWVPSEGSSECWETSMGQEVYRLVIIDFLFAIVGASLAEFCRFQIYKRIWKNIGAPEFDIARSTLNIIYNQTLFFVGFYFSPLLALVVTVKMFVTFYIRKLGLLHSCQPSARPWRASQTQTLFLALSFVAILIVLILLGYIITQVDSSPCGPFRHYTFPYDVILDVFQVRDDSNGFMLFILFITKPGVIGLILLAMCVAVYYVRAQSLAYDSMLCLLREMLVLEGKDKEFLLNSIERVTESYTDVSPAPHISSKSQKQRFQTGVHEHSF